MKLNMKINECSGITAIVLMTTALVLALVGNFWCKFAYTPFTFTSNLNSANSTTYNIYYGIWNYQYFSTVYYESGGDLYATTYAGCRAYSGQYMSPNTNWNSAKAFTIIAVCIGGIANFASCCAIGKPSLWRIVSIALFITTIFQGLVFLFLSSNACQLNDLLVDNKDTSSTAVTVTVGDGCGLASGANVAISAAVLWFVSAVAAALACGKGASEESEEAVSAKQQENAEVVEGAQ